MASQSCTVDGPGCGVQHWGEVMMQQGGVPTRQCWRHPGQGGCTSEQCLEEGKTGRRVGLPGWGW